MDNVYTGPATTASANAGCVGSTLGQVWTVPYDSYTTYPTTFSTLATCSGESHQFACKHEQKCKCGKTQRVGVTCALCQKGGYCGGAPGCTR